MTGLLKATKPFWQELLEVTAKKFCENFAQECGQAVGKKVNELLNGKDAEEDSDN